MPRIRIPSPPPHSAYIHSMTRDGGAVAHIWVFTDKGLATIETQYANVKRIMSQLGVSRATAYRIIQRHRKRYWLCDMRPTEQERCFCVLPVELLAQVVVHPVGNPNFCNGIYQQGIARRPRKRRR